MGTTVTIQVIRAGREAEEAISRAFGWFHAIEDRCTRFREESELVRLTSQTGIPVAVSTILYEAVRFAVMVAEESHGAFDPTAVHPRRHDSSYRDIVFDPDRRTITLRRPLMLDLGAVAKGLAVDTAARELEPFTDFAIDAGGDLYLGGSNQQGAPWSVGIRHPRREHELIASLSASNQAVCTSGDYERRTPDGSGRHILDPRTGASADRVASATVVASGAMLADALATAAFVLGPQEGIEFLNRLGVEGLLVTPELERFETGGLRHAA